MIPDHNLDEPVAIGDYSLNFDQTVTTDTLEVRATVVHAFPYAGDPRACGDVAVFVDSQLVGTSHSSQFTHEPPYTFRFHWTIPRSAIRSGAGTSRLHVRFAPWSMPVIGFLHRDITLSPFAHPSSRVLKTLAPGRIIRSVFQSEEAVTDPAMMLAFKDAGINTVEIGCFHNPADGHPGSSFEVWYASQLASLQPKIDAAKSAGLYILAIGDDFLRTDAERDWFLNTEWSPQAAQAIATILRDSGVCLGVEMVDEADHHIPGGSANPALQRLVEAWRAVPNAPKLAWPGQYPQTFEAAGYSDYCSRYIDPTHQALPHRKAMPTFLDALLRAQDRLLPGKPWLCQSVIAGPYYVKRVAGDNYQDGDELVDWGMRPSDVKAIIWVALCFGACGFRSYLLDHSGIQHSRSSAPLGTLLQTGGKPGDERWAALAEACSLIQQYESELTSEYHGHEITGHLVTGYWEGLTVIVNTSEGSEPCPALGRELLPGEVVFFSARSGTRKG